ncbi:phosphoglycerate mutase family protein [Hymenobacter chitinivorans]|uniref:Histidine phosphatase superfamily protein (Branch 1) n=1 Tax=Hymenobacter chitinivorans DSM 11115 TaxID=1121954 RepID=A0A2M9BQK3_9BACT|nr:phosphoglycerate mutase family protein [Hymenobacter chitinivorans]PJJ60226.1 histidine phosphatase superfamily protein (branch 1) [Hymenobacter chitinivorans DSM 11115]
MKFAFRLAGTNRVWALSGLLFALWLGLLGCAASKPGAAAVTTVYIVRHAEKDPTPGLPDPALTPAGEARALALREQLGKQPIAAIFTTNTTRTRTTAAPLAQQLGLTPQVYDAKQQSALVERIKTEFAGKKVLVVGHSNTILETAEALGATRPVPTVQDNEFSYLLEVKLPAAGPATATARQYGAAPVPVPAK